MTQIDTRKQNRLSNYLITCFANPSLETKKLPQNRSSAAASYSGNPILFFAKEPMRADRSTPSFVCAVLFFGAQLAQADSNCSSYHYGHNICNSKAKRGYNQVGNKNFIIRYNTRNNKRI